MIFSKYYLMTSKIVKIHQYNQFSNSYESFCTLNGDILNDNYSDEYHYLYHKTIYGIKELIHDFYNIHLHYINIYLVKENKEIEKLNDSDSISTLQNLKEDEIVVANILIN